MNVEEQEKRLLDYKWHERRYSKDTCYILSTQGTEEPNIFPAMHSSNFASILSHGITCMDKHLNIVGDFSYLCIVPAKI